MNQSASKVETPREAAPAEVFKMAQKLEALRNDIPPEKRNEAKFKADFGRLEGRINTITKSRKASVEELAQINHEFEKLRESLEIKNFAEKFELSESIILYLKAHPKVKPETLKAADFTKNPDLQKPNVWKNILEDAVKGLAITKACEDKDFDWANPKDYIAVAEKAWKEHPVATVACVIGGAYAAYKLWEMLFGDDSTLWDKTKGGIAGGIAAWAGLSAFGKTAHTDLAEMLIGKVVGEKNLEMAKKILGLDKKEAGQENAESGLEKFAPKTAAALKKFGGNLQEDNKPGSKESFWNFFKANEEEGGETAAEVKEDGTFSLMVIPKGIGKAFTYTWKLTGGMFNEFGEYLAKPENPWYERGAGMFIKFDSILLATGATIGVGKSLLSIVTNPTVNPFEMGKRVAKGFFKGATVGQYELVKGAYNWRQTALYYQTSYQLAKLNIVEGVQRPGRFLKSPLAHFAGKAETKLAREAYFLQRVKLESEMECYTKWLSSAEQKQVSAALAETKRLAKNSGISMEAVDQAVLDGGKTGEKRILRQPITETKTNTANAVTKGVGEIDQRSFFKAEDLRGKTAAEIKELSQQKQARITKLEYEVKQLTGESSAGMGRERSARAFSRPTKGGWRTTPEIGKVSELPTYNTYLGGNYSPEALSKIEEIKALRCDLEAMKVYINPQAYAQTKLNTLEGFEKLSETQKIEAVKNAAAQMESLEVGQSAQFRAKIEAAKKSFDAKQITQEQFQKQLAELDEEAITFGRSKLAKIKELKAAQNSLPKEAKEMLGKQVSSAIDNMDNSLCTRVVKGVKGRAKMAVVMASAMFAIDKAINWNSEDETLMGELQRMGPDLKQLLLDVSPVGGTFSNFYSAFSGREIVSGRDVSGAWQRVSNVIWGGVSAVGDTLTIVSAIPSGGASLGGAALVRLGAIASKGGKLAKPAEFLIKNWSKVAKVAERAGGWRKFLGKLGESEKAVAGLRKIERVGVMAGTAMIAGSAVNLTYGFLSEGPESEIPE